MSVYTPGKSRLRNVSTPSAWSGIGSMIDICGVLNDYQFAATGPEADYEALRSDWLAVGDYIAEAIRLHREEISAEPASER